VNGVLTRPVRLAAADLMRLGLVGVRARPLRAVLSALGITIGVATVLVVVGIPASSRQALDRELSALGTNLLSAAAVADQSTGTLPPLPEGAAAMAARIGPVTGAAQVANTHAKVWRSDRVPAEQPSGLTVLATDAALAPVLGLTAAQGRPLADGDQPLPVAVLGSQAATELGITALPPGAPPPLVRVGGRWFTVVGVLRSAPLAPDLDRSLLVGRAAARRWLGFDGRPTVVYVRAREAQLQAVRSVLAATVNPENPGRVVVARPSEALAAKRLAEAAFSGLFLGLAAVALLVGAVGVANTMVVSVLERTREVGLRRALGSTGGQIRAQFLAESVALSAGGGAVGALLGFLGTGGYAKAKGWPVALPLPAVAGAVLAAALIGAAAGAYSAVRASRLPPTTALAPP
jgi:putative ABC transport system permease protein